MLKPLSIPQSEPAASERFDIELRVIRHPNGRYAFARVNLRSNGDIFDIGENPVLATESDESLYELYESALQKIKRAFDKPVIDVEQADV
jgi:hypothetical protein